MGLLHRRLGQVSQGERLGYAAAGFYRLEKHAVNQAAVLKL